jgi:S1-C subfamily serine protease
MMANHHPELFMKSSLLLILSLVFFSACGKKSSDNRKRVTRITEEQIQEVLENQQFECASINNTGCPKGMARLLTINRADPDNSSVCSGFMVGPNRMVTNHHCISNQNECENTYVVIYNGTTPVLSRCINLISSEQDYADPNDDRRAIDYSVVQTEGNWNGKTFELSPDRAVVGDGVRVWVIDHTGLDDPFNPNLLDSRVTEFRCNVEDQTSKASLMLRDCPVIAGNSGSPAFNLAGRVVGVVWGATASQLNANTPLDFRRSLDEFAAVTEMIHFQPYVQ